MIAARELAGPAILALACSMSCSARTDAQTRAAFEAASRPTSSDDGTPRERPGRRPRPAADDPRTAWQSVGELLDSAITLFGLDNDAVTFTAAATAWCAVAPEPKSTAAALSYACFPREPMVVAGRTFTLEVSPDGAIGLLIDELDEAASRALADQARAATERLCATAFVAVPADDASISAFHTCPVDGGSTLAVGCARATTGPGWFVSVTVLGALRRSAAP